MAFVQAAVVVGFVALAGCQGADAYHRQVRQAPGSGGAKVDLGEGGDSLFEGNDGSIDISGPQAGFDGPDLVDASLPAPPDGSDGGSDGGRDGGGETGCGLCALDVLYWCEGTSANTIRATFSLVNDTEVAVPLSELTIRYWFTDGSEPSPWEFACDVGTVGVTGLQPPPSDVTREVTGVFRKVSPSRPGADMYFEVGFLAAAGDLLPGQSSLFRTRVYRVNYRNITQADDYSFDSKNTAFAPSRHITLYRNGQLLSGVEPPAR
jgi:hypothetical protein